MVGSLKLQVSSTKEPYKRDYILQKRPIILRRLAIVATPYTNIENEEARALLDHVDEYDTITTSSDTPQASASVDTTHSSLAHNGLGARAEDDAAVAMQAEIMSQGEEGEQRRMAGGDDGQHNTGASQETTQEAPDITLATGETRIPSVSTNDTLANNIATNGSGARTEDNAAITMEGVIMSQVEDGEQSRMAGGGAGQHTTGASESPGAMSSGGLDTSTRARQPFKFRAPDKPRYAIRLGAVGPKSRILHRRWARRLRLRPSQHQRQRDSKGRRQIVRDGAWVR